MKQVIKKINLERILLNKINIETIKLIRSNLLGEIFLVKTKDKKDVYVINKNQIKKQKKAFYIMSILKKENILAPEPLFYLNKENLLIYKSLNGLPYLNKLKKNNSTIDLCKDINKLCKLIFSFHKIDYKKIKNIKKETKNNLIYEKKWWQDTIKKNAGKKYTEKLFTFQNFLFKKYFNNWNIIKFKLTHNDFTLDNIIEYKNKFGLIDFYDALISDPIKDIASFNVRLLMMANKFPKQYSNIKLKKSDIIKIEKNFINHYLKISKDKKYFNLRYIFWKNFWFSRMYSWFVEVEKYSPKSASFLLKNIYSLSNNIL